MLLAPSTTAAPAPFTRDRDPQPATRDQKSNSKRKKYTDALVDGLLSVLGKLSEAGQEVLFAVIYNHT